MINQNHQHFQNVFIVQLDSVGAAVVGPESVVVSVGPGGGLRVTGFSQAYFDSKLIRAPRKSPSITIFRPLWTVFRARKRPDMVRPWKPVHGDLIFESLPGHI